MLGLNAQYSLTQAGVMAAVSTAGLRHIYGIAGTLENNLRLNIPMESIAETLAPQVAQLEWDQKGKQPQLIHQNRMLERIVAGTVYPDADGRKTDAHVVLGSIYHAIERINPQLYQELSGFAGKLTLPPPSMSSRRRTTGHYSSAAPPAATVVPKHREGQIECLHCQSWNPVSKSFCGDCGEDISDDSQYVPRAQNMRGTILFTDFQGFTDMSQSMPAEVLFGWLNRQFNLLGAEIMRQGGWFVKNIGDAIMVVFNQHEDHARRGVSTAVRMLQILEQVNPQLKGMGLPALQMRIGVHTGNIAVGYLGGPGSKRADAIGRAVNLASRLESFKLEKGARTINVPDGNRVLVSGATLSELAGGFEHSFIDKVAFKGVEQPVEVYHIQGELPGASVADRYAGSQSQFRGRRREMDQLQATFVQAMQGQPQLALISGEAGQGKSRLALEFLNSMKGPRERHIKVIAARGVDRDYHPPYALMSDALTHLAGIEADDELEEIEVKIRSLVWLSKGLGAEEQEQMAQLLGRLMGIPFRTEFSPQERLKRETIEMRQRVFDNIESMASDQNVLRMAIHRAVIQFFQEHSRYFSLILSLEDVHWSDQESLELLHEVFASLEDRPVMVVGTMRPEFDTGPGFQLEDIFAGDYKAEPIQLRELSMTDMRSIVQDILGESSQTDPEVVNYVIWQAAGNVFLLHEMAQAVKDGWLQRGETPEEWRLVGAHDERRTVGADNFLQTRLERLSPAERSVVDYAAVISDAFDLQLIQELGIPNAGVHLGQLVQKQILHQDRQGKYRFRHDMMRAKAYAMMSHETRRDLHRDMAELLVEHEVEDKALIAYHLDKGEQTVAAARYYLDGAEQAQERALYRQALRYYDRVFALGREEDNQLALRGLLGGNEVALDMRDTESAYARIELAADLLQSGIEREVRSQYFYRLAHTLQVDRNDEIKANLFAAEQAVKNALKRYDDVEVSPMKAQLLATLGRIYAERRDFQVGQTYIRQAIVTAKAAHDDDVVAETYLHQMYMDLQYGDYGSVIKLGNDVDALLKSPKFAKRRIARNVNVGGAHINLGNYEEALRIYQVTETLSREKFAGTYLPNIVPNVGTCLRLLGRSELALQHLDRAIELFSHQPNAFMAGVTQLYRALTLLDLKRYDEADEAATRVYAVSQAGNEPDPKLEAMAHMAHAQIQLAQDQLQAAEQSSAEAYRLLLASEWHIEEFDLEIALTHARILWKQGKSEEAWQVLHGTEQVKGARQELVLRAEKLDLALQANFYHRNRVNAAIVQMWEAIQLERLRSNSNASLGAIVQEALTRVQPGMLTPDIEAYAQQEPGKLSALREVGNHQLVGVLLNSPYIVTLGTVLSRKLEEMGAAETMEAGLSLTRAVWRPSFNEDGRPIVYWDFDLDSDNVQILSALNTIGNVRRHIHATYEGDVSYSDGVIKVTFNLTQETETFTTDQFGAIELLIGATTDGRSVLALRAEKGAFTARPDILLQDLAEGL